MHQSWKASFGKKIFAFRSNLGIDLFTFSQRTGLGIGEIELIESGVLEPSRLSLNSICYVLDITYEDIFVASIITLKKTGRVNIEEIFDNLKKLRNST